jgi:4-diphosphocytidyl-2-C-methyl-D-erythritol kinase
MTGASVTLDAPAKLTLTLRVTGVRDDGYHLIDAEMIVLDLADRLTITATPSTVARSAHDHEHAITISCDGPFSHGVPLDATNLVAKAMRLVGAEGHVHVHKAIPHGGGLGGGSADAAAVLRWAGYTDLVAASRLGADIPFCLVGQRLVGQRLVGQQLGSRNVGGRARVRGIGEIVDPLPPRSDPLTVTLVVPPLQVSTPDVYAAWDRLGAPTEIGPNDLEPAALEVEPRLGVWRDRIIAASGERPVLAGSGATWFLIGDHGHIASALSEATVVVTSERVADAA